MLFWLYNVYNQCLSVFASSIKIATTSQTIKHTLENITVALPHIIAHIPDGWNNVQSLHIKTSQSVSLPIWTCDLGDGDDARWRIPQVSADGIPVSPPSKRRKRDGVTDEANKRLKATSASGPLPAPLSILSPSSSITTPSLSPAAAPKPVSSKLTKKAPKPKVPSVEAASSTVVPAVGAPNTTPSLSELKAKRSSALEGKKDKISKAKGKASGRGVKSRVIGN